MKVAKVSAGSLPPEPIPVAQIESKVSRAFKLKKDEALFDGVLQKLQQKKYTPIAKCREELCQLTDPTGKSLLVRALELDPPDQTLIAALVTDKIALGMPAPSGDMPLDLAARRGDLCAIELLYPLQSNKMKESALEIAVASGQTSAVIKLLTLPKLNDRTPLWSSLINISTRYCQEGFFTGALEILWKALAVAEESFRDKKDKGNCVITLHNLAGTLAALRQFSEALVYYQRAYDLFNEIYERTDEDFLPLICDLANCHTSLNDHKMARVFLREACEILKEVYHEPHPKKISILNAIAMSYARSGSMEQVDEYAQYASAQALELEDSQIVLAEVLDNKSRCYFLNKQYQKALDIHQEAFNFLLVFAENDHPLMIDCLEHLAECHKQLGNEEKAKALKEDASMIKTQLGKKTE